MIWILNKPFKSTNDASPRSIKDRIITEIPKWVDDQLAIGDEVTVKNIDGELHWYSKGIELFEAKPLKDTPK